jgi:HSP20 family molecular chaperone IbpA
MPGPEIPALRSTDHEFVAGLRFLDEYAKHLFSRTNNDLSHGFVPRFDLEDHEGTYELYGELPGFDKDHITVEANDDRNIQISGWIPRKHTDATVVSDPSVTVQHRTLPPAEDQPTMERSSEVLNPHHEVHHDAPAPVVSHSLATPNPSPAPPHEEKPETARFGDILNPHARFAHRAKDGKPKVRHLIAERQYGQFHRSFHFPSPIKKDEVQARLDNGILHISAPKAAVPPATKIEIKKAGSS